MSAERGGETWREAITRAVNGVGEAEAERKRVLSAAAQAGLSTREIASVAGVAGSTVWRWIGEPSSATTSSTARGRDGGETRART